MNRARWAVVGAAAAAVVAGVLHPWTGRAAPSLPCPVPILCPTTTTSTSTTSTTAPTTTTTAGGGSGPRAIPAPIHGVTIDGISNISDVVAAARAFGQGGHMPTTRVYLDVTQPPSYYVSALQALRPYGYVMGELLDSSDMPNTTPAAEHARVAQYLSVLGPYVDVWEVGNEVNGNWTCDGSSGAPCTSSGYQAGAAMVMDTFAQVQAAGYASALTFWYNAGCAGTNEPDPLAYTDTYLSGDSALLHGLDYVLISYYQTTCNNYALTNTDVAQFMDQLNQRFPNASTGFGEVGLPNKASLATQSTAEQIIGHYYGLDPGRSNYIGGYFYWYYDEDALPYKNVAGQENPIWSALNTGFGSQPR